MIQLILITFGGLSFFFPRSKELSVCLFFLFWLLWGWNSWNGDYDAYEQVYYQISNYGVDSVSYEFGFEAVNFFVGKLGYDFQSFMKIYSFIILSIIFSFVRKSTFPAFFSLLYVVIFIMSYVYMRNYFADALLFHFVLIAVSDIKKKKKITYAIILFVLAVLFHNTSILFFSFLLAFIDRLNTKKLLLLVGGIIVLVFTSINVVLSLISDAALLAKIQYYQASVSPIGPAISHLIVATAPSLFLYANQQTSRTFSPKTVKALSILERINIISLIYIPLYFVIPDFSRFFKVLFTINIFFLLELYPLFNAHSKRIALSFVFLAIYAILLYQFSFSTLEFTLYPLFESNLIFENQ